MITNFARYILGAVLLMTGFNKFFGFLTMPQMSPEGMQFMGALMETGYMMPLIASVEIISGALLFSVATAPFAVLFFAPVALNILVFHLALAPETLMFGGFVFALNLFLGIRYFSYYRPIFAKVFTERVLITEKKPEAANPPVAVLN